MMAFISLVFAVILALINAENVYLQFTARKADDENLPFSQIHMNIQYENNQLSADVEVQRTPESHDVTNIYQLTRNDRFYSSKLLGIEAKQRFLDAERIFDPDTWDSATLDDVNSVYLKRCIDVDRDSEWFQSLYLVGPTLLEDRVFRDENLRIIIQFLNRKYVLAGFENGLPTKLFISGDKEGVFRRAEVISFEYSTSAPLDTQWSIALPSDETCTNLNAHEIIYNRHSVTMNDNGELIPDTDGTRRLGAEDTRTGPCRDSECCPTGLENKCIPHKQLFMTHDAYRDVTCPVSYAGNTCTRVSTNGDNALICRDYSNTFQYTGENRCYVSIAGSDDINDWLNNINFLSTGWEGYTTHSGFRDEFNGIGMLIYNNLGACLSYNKIEIMGHSLGGVMAILLGTYIAKYNPSINVKVVTIGAPHVFEGNRPNFGTRYNQISYMAEYLDWDNPIVWYYWDPCPYLPTSSWTDPINTQYVRLCYKKDEVCNCSWGWEGWTPVYRCNCVTYHHYYSQSGVCDDSFGLPSVDQHRRSASYNYMESMNYGGCAQD